MSKHPTHCQECGTALQAAKSKAGQQPKFCSTDCRRTFNNRRATRGAELYDFFMSGRFQRKDFPAAITTTAQMAAGWREEDKAMRDGRPSWGDISKSDR